MKSDHVAIIGAGLVGSLLAVILKKRGYKVTIYERRSDMRKEQISGGRSINLALSDRGIKALEMAGLMEQIRNICIPMPGRQIHQADGSEDFQPYGKQGQYINSVSRGELNKLLMSAAENEGVDIIFNHRCTGIQWDDNRLVLMDLLTRNEVQLQADLIFAADGAYSAGRLQMQLHTDRFDYQQSFINFGYKELNIPAGKDGAFLLKKNALHIWPRGNYMLIALPNTDGSFTCTLFFPFEGTPSFQTLTDTEKVTQFFKENFPDAFPLMPTLAEDFNTNPTSSLVTISCYPWTDTDRFALIGDAAHAMVPFYGQGMNCGFEDCAVLSELLDQYPSDWKKVLDQYQHLRKPDADAISSLALLNFIEMRDKVGDEKFLLQKKIEVAFSKKHPEAWIPAYSLVTFSPQIRYSEAMQRSRRQQEIMDDIMKIPHLEEKWDTAEIENTILQKLKNEN